MTKRVREMRRKNKKKLTFKDSAGVDRACLCRIGRKNPVQAEGRSVKLTEMIKAMERIMLPK
jgi:hypothetical protein